MLPRIDIGELAGLATAVLWTMSVLFWTAAGRRAGSLAVSFLRIILTCGLLSGYHLLAYRSVGPTGVTAADWGLLALSGLTGFFFCDVLLFKALVVIGPRLSLLIYSLTPAMTAMLAWGTFGEAMAPWQIVGMAITLGGVGWVVLEKSTETKGDRPISAAVRHPGGLLLAVLANVGAALGAVFARQAVGDNDAVSATMIRALGSLPGFVALTTVLGRWRPVTRTACDRRSMALIVGGTLVGPVLGVICYMVSFRHCPAGVTTTLTSLMPVLILPFSALLLRERVTWRAAAGALIAVGGVVVLVWGEPT
jgi:drug/metabolite transporter (DMT)-like permease